MSLPAALPSGTVIGSHYIIGDLINSGGFGAVYRGVDTSEGNRLCAIKETYDVTPAARRQALMEAGVLFTVRTRHLPEVYDALEANGRFYLIMQLIEGQNLLQLLQTRISGVRLGEQLPNQLATGPCSEQEVLNWLLPIIEVLQELHSRNPPIMHRDIKPGNIIITPQQTAVLVDFGLTKLYDPSHGTQTVIKAVSEGFSPIEQYLGKTSPQSDIYSLAATMYLLLTNRLPPPAISRSLQDEIIAPHLLNPTISFTMERALLKALALQADQRYPDMSAFSRALTSSGFDAHADQTIVAPPVNPLLPSTMQAKPAPPVRTYPPIVQSSHYHQQSSQPYPGSLYPTPPMQASGPYSTLPPYASGPYQPSGPYYPPGYNGYSQPVAPPGYVMVPQTNWPVPTPVTLPSPFGQGCLWGLLQGVAAGLLVFFLRQQFSFYLAILGGFLFCIIAGMRVTRKGGSSTRGGWAGYWASIHGTLFFWLTLGIALFVGMAQRAQVIAAKSIDITSARVTEIAWRDVQPHWLDLWIIRTQPFWGNIAALIAVALIIAWLLGWIGGLLGRLGSTTSGATTKR